MRHRIVEIGCIELENQIPTNNIFHYYLSLERKVSEKHFKFMVMMIIFYLRKENF